MAKNVKELRTKRLVLKPMTKEEILVLANTNPVEAMRENCKRLLNKIEEDPDNYIWYAPWKITLKKDGTYIGEIGFQGPETDHYVEIGFGVKEEYRGNGYTTEAVKMFTEWAFSCPGVFFVEAEASDDNHASKKVLEKLEFVPDGIGETGTKYYKESADSWFSVFMCMGLSFGMIYGSLFGSVGIGLSIGISVGLMVGALIDYSLKQKRTKVREAHHNV